MPRWCSRGDMAQVIKGEGKVVLDAAKLKAVYEGLRHDGVLKEGAANWGRFDLLTRGVFCATALALHAAGVPIVMQEKKNTGMLFLNPAGALAANQAYFSDYITHGRGLGRGNLFLYTLTTSPLAETAIYFGFCGPLLYRDSDRKIDLSKEAAEFIRCGEAAQMVMVYGGRREVKAQCV